MVIQQRRIKSLFDGQSEKYEISYFIFLVRGASRQSGVVWFFRLQMVRKLQKSPRNRDFQRDFQKADGHTNVRFFRSR